MRAVEGISLEGPEPRGKRRAILRQNVSSEIPSSKAPAISPTLPGLSPHFGGGLDEAAEEVDPELLVLPSPPRRDRTLAVVVLAVAAAAALAMAAALRGDVAYALSRHTPASLGDLRTATAEALAESENRYVRAEGMLGVAGGIRYEHLFVEDTFRTLPVAGRSSVWVDLRVPAGQENGRWEPPASLSGRLVRFDEAGPRHRGLEAAIAQSTQVPVPGGAWLLVDGEAPQDARWAVVLAALFVGCAAWNAIAIGRILRKVR
jgi:hypothetical protein